MIKLGSKFPAASPFWILVFLNVFAAAFYFVMFHAMGSAGHVNEILFSSPDSQEYRGHGEWLSGQTPYCNPNRTFFYPLLLLLVHSIGGNAGIWIVQFLLWLMVCNLSFLSVRKAGAGLGWQIIAFLLVATYLSGICLTAHALTEITVMFFLSVFTFILSGNLHNLRSIRVGFQLLLVLSVLFAIKPFYQVHLFLGIAIFLFVHFRDLLKRPMLFLVLTGCVSPALVQYGISRAKHGSWNSDQIAAINFKFYLMNKVDYVVATNDLNQFNYLGDSVYKVRHDRIDKMSMGEVTSYLVDHPAATMKVIYDNLRLNIRDGSTYIDAMKHPDLIDWNLKMNGRFFRLHCCMLAGIFIFFLAMLFRRKKAFDFWLLSLAFMSYSVLLVTGITFWAGDRLVVPAIAVWAVIYPVFFSFVMKNFFVGEQAYLKKWLPVLYKGKR